MARNTEQYRMDYFERGSLYSGSIDYKRFTTLDYNMESYIGITGVGIISGWTIEQIEGLTINILPGKGIINGFAVESPYVFKKRSEMVIPEREVEVVNTDKDKTPELDLTEEQKTQYVSVIQYYNPFYNPEPDEKIENSYVKIVVPHQEILFDNNDNYIYAERVSQDPYPSLVNYPSLTVEEPLSRDYETYDEYIDAKQEYDEQIQAIHDYEWREQSENHFTIVKFEVALSLTKNNNKILLGKVVTRGGEIKNIDLRGVDSLENMKGQIQHIAKNVIQGHIHGGTKNFDPTHVSLNTEIRNAVFKNQISPDKASYIVLPSDKTSVAEGHKHDYFIDNDGDGYTVGLLGGDKKHFHYIKNNIVLTNEFTPDNITSHIHTIPTNVAPEAVEDILFNVYVNGFIVGDQTDVLFNQNDQTIELDKKSGQIYAKYSTSFFFTNNSKTQLYEYSLRTFSLLSFMSKMINDFDIRYGREMFNEADLVTSDQLLVIPEGHPFIFISDDGGGWDGLDDLQTQCIIGEQFLNKIGDTFTFTPNAAQNITVTLEDVPFDSKFDVKVEILGSSEVTGTIKDTNILYINASKIVLGIFDVARIPFIDHIGRMNENCLPFENYISSKNGIEYKVIPSVTSTDMDHSHNVFVNQSYTGVTQQTFIGEDPVYYGTGTNGIDTYLISHIHGISNGEILESSSTGLTDWQTDLNNVISSIHKHDLIMPYPGDPKTIYSIQENKSGHIYVGTASGLYIIPNGNAYVYVINGESLYLIGDDLWYLLLEAKRQYESITGVSLTVTEEIYASQLIIAERSLTNEGDSYLMTGIGSPSEGVDEIMIQKVNAFSIPSFKSIDYKYPFELKSNEIVTDIILKFESTGEEIIDFNEITKDTAGDVVQLYKVERYLQRLPIWSIELRDGFSNDVNGEYIDDTDEIPIEDLFVCSSDVIALHRNLEESFYDEWSLPNVHRNIDGIRKIVKDDKNNLWLTTNNGLFVSRAYQNGRSFYPVNLPGFSRDIRGVVDIGDGTILCASGYSIYKSENGGKTWSTVKTFQFLLTDLSQDERTDKKSIIFSTLRNRDIYRSTDGGGSWSIFSVKPQGDSSDIYAFNEKVFVGLKDGLYRYYSGSGWNKVLDKNPYSFKKSYDGNSFLIGCHNELYKSIDGENFELLYAFNGLPLPVYLKDGMRYNYGYAYNSLGNAFHFKDFTYLDNNIETTVVTNYERWMAEDGPWGELSDYEIFLDNTMVLSTVDGIDKRGTVIDQFKIDPKSGILDFGAHTTLASDVNVYDYGIHVLSVEGFYPGDRVVIKTDITLPDFPEFETTSDYGSDFRDFKEKIIQYGIIATEINEMIVYSKISHIIGNYIYLDKRISIAIKTPASVYKLPRLEGTNEIWMNIFESSLLNSGKNSHEKIEDSLSIASDLRPYRLNNSYLSNILQLTQAVRYAYPEIGINHKNNLYYDFNYDEDELNKHINLLSSEMYSATLYDSKFIKKNAKCVNRIISGYGDFTGFLFAGTDIGIFWMKIAEGFEGNWFYVNTLMEPVYDLIIKDGNTIIAATDSGLHYSSDMIAWTVEESKIAQFPVYNIGFRWPQKEQINISGHIATLSNDDYDDPLIGYIESNVQSYIQIRENRFINLINAGSFDGYYNVIDVSDQRITVDKAFDGLTEPLIYNSIEIQQSSWWEKISNIESGGSSDIPNTLVISGLNRISYKNGDSGWNDGSVPTEVDGFLTTDIVAMDNGSMLISAIGFVKGVNENLILKTSDLGDEWKILFGLKEINGDILKYSKNKNGNTELIVRYKKPENYLYVDGNAVLNVFGLFAGENIDTAIERSYIVWNYFLNGDHHITLHGEGIYNKCVNSVLNNLNFKIYPLRINSMLQTESSDILFGTSNGIYTDRRTILGNSLVAGSILRSGETGRVVDIDIRSVIVSISYNIVSRNAILSLKTNSSISRNELINQKIYITDLEPSPSFIIIGNTVRNSNGELSVEIGFEYNDNLLNYIGKKTVVVPSRSVLKVVFDRAVNQNAFAGGKLYVISNEKNNIGTSYNIISNTNDSVTVSSSIIPSGTSVYADPFKTKDIMSGQQISMIDASNKLKLIVSFGEYVKENQFAGKTLIYESNSYSIHSNSKDNIVLESYQPGSVTPPILNFKRGVGFSVRGETFESMASFNSKKSSVESNHYHNLNLIGNIVFGNINSINLGDYETIIDIDIVSGWSSLFEIDGSIIDNAMVRFYNPLSNNYSEYVRAIHLEENKLIVSTENIDLWSELGYDKFKISESWKWELDATLYGYTQETIYSGFIVYNVKITKDILKDSEIIEIYNSNGMVEGDNIEITDGFGSINSNTIAEVIDINNIRVTKPISNSFFIYQNARVKVIRDYFENNHIHQIKRNEIAEILVEEYNERGYPSKHSHVILPYIHNVTDIAECDYVLMAVGSGSEIFESNNGSSWKLKTNLNHTIDGDNEIDAVSTISGCGDSAIIGTSNGFIATPLGANDLVKLEKPFV
jgi:hypothetical protein